MNRGMTVVAIPKRTANVFITNMADMAAKKTVLRECLIAIMAAMKKVLSPNSETIITESDAMNAWKNLTCPKRDHMSSESSKL